MLTMVMIIGLIIIGLIVLKIFKIISKMFFKLASIAMTALVVFRLMLLL